MHIVICCNSFPLLSQTFVTSQVMGLARRGHRVTVVAEWMNEALLTGVADNASLEGTFSLGESGTPPLSNAASRLRLIGRAVAAAPAFLRSSPHSHIYLRRLLRWRGVMAARAYALASAFPKIDLVHAHMGSAALWARAIALRHRVPLVVTFHGTDATRDPLEIGWEPYRHLLDPSSTTFIVHSPFVADRLQAGLGIDPHSVPLGIDTGTFSPPQHPRDARLRSEKPRLAFVGRLIPMKGVRIAIEALALLRRGESGRALDATLDIVGEGPEASAIPALSEALGVAPAVRVHGPQPPAGVAAWLRESDVLLVPSLDDVDGRAEAYGLVCLEAQACEVPVVGTYCGGLSSAIAPPAGGRCVPQHSPHAMAEAVRIVLSEFSGDALRAKLRERILESHVEDRSLEVYERLFEGAIRRSQGMTIAPDGAGMPRSASWVPPIAVPRGPQGSLAAYVSGRKVLEIKRRFAALSGESLQGMAESWSVAVWGDGTAPTPSMKTPPDVLLDLDGISLGTLGAEAAAARRAYAPRSFMIVAVLSGEREPIEIDAAQLEREYRDVVLLDRLFVPYGDSPDTSPRPVGGGTKRLESPELRYVLCVV